MRQGHKRATRVLRTGLATGSLLLTGLATTTVIGVHAAGATVSVHGGGMVSTLDTPDPDVVYSGSGTKYYAYGTGTTNRATPVPYTWPAQWTGGGISLTPLGCTAGGCAVTGVAHVAMSPTSIPSSVTIKYGLQAPSVAHLGGQWVMYYAGHYTSSGQAYAIYYSTSSSPTTGFTSPSTEAPLMYQTSAGGSTDPSVFIGNSGNASLQWKSGTYAAGPPASLWSMSLTSTGLGMTGTPYDLVNQPLTTAHLWDYATIENPDMIYSGGAYYLFYSGGHWTKTTYAEGYVTCSGPTSGPTSCSSALTSHEILSGTASAPYGPGGASLFTATTGTWLMAYHGWNKSCTAYATLFGSCGASRQLYVGLTSGLSPTTPSISSFTSSTNALTATGGTVTLTARATGAASYTFTTSSTLTGLPATVRTTAGSAGVTVGIPANTSSSVETYTVTVTASGLYGGHVSSQLNVSVGAPRPAVALNPGTGYAPTVFFEGSGNTMVNDWYTPSGGGHWNSTTVPGSAYSAPAVQLNPGTGYAPTVFFEGPNHTIVNDWYTPSGGGHWNSTTVPGSAYSAPAVQLNPGTGYAPTVFFEGPNHTIVNDWYTPSGGGHWNSTTVPGSVYSAPAVALNPGTAYAPTVFFEGSGNTMVNDWYTPSGGGHWNSTTDPGSVYSAPAVALNPGTAYAPTVFFEGSGNTMVNDWYTPSGGGHWNSTTDPGSVYSAPAVALNPGTAYAPTVFFEGSGNTMVNDWYTPSGGGHWNSTTDPGSVYSAPAVQLNPGTGYAPTVFFEGSGNTMVNDWYTPSGGGHWNSTTVPW